MSILYSTIVYKETKILTDCTEYYGNIQQTAKQLIKAVKKKNFKGTICFDTKYAFHYLDENSITYLCLSDKSYPIDVAHYFLSQLKELLFNNFSIDHVKNCDQFGLDLILKPKIRQKQDFFNQDESGVNEIRKELLLDYSNKQNVNPNFLTKNSKLYTYNKYKAEQNFIDLRSNYFNERQSDTTSTETQERPIYDIVNVSDTSLLGLSIQEVS